MLTFGTELPQEQLARDRTEEAKLVSRLNKRWFLDNKWNDYSTPWSSGSQMQLGQIHFFKEIIPQTQGNE